MTTRTADPDTALHPEFTGILATFRFTPSDRVRVDRLTASTTPMRLTHVRVEIEQATAPGRSPYVSVAVRGHHLTSDGTPRATTSAGWCELDMLPHPHRARIIGVLNTLLERQHMPTLNPETARFPLPKETP